MEAEITDAHRAYLGAFDRWLRDPSVTHEAERATALAAISNAPPRPGETRVDYEERPVEQTAQRQPRPVKVVVAEALQEIRAREARIERIADELPECKAARKALERLLPGGGVQQRTPTTPVVATPTASAASGADTSNTEGNQRQRAAERDARVHDAVRQLQPATSTAIAEHVGEDAEVVRASLTRLRMRGAIMATGVSRGARWCVLTAGDEDGAEVKDGDA